MALKPQSPPGSVCWTCNVGRLNRFKVPFLAQRAEYPLIKEYGLNHNMKPLMISGMFLN